MIKTSTAQSRNRRSVRKVTLKKVVTNIAKNYTENLLKNYPITKLGGCVRVWPRDTAQ